MNELSIFVVLEATKLLASTNVKRFCMFACTVFAWLGSGVTVACPQLNVRVAVECTRELNQRQRLVAGEPNFLSAVVLLHAFRPADSEVKVLSVTSAPSSGPQAKLQFGRRWPGSSHWER